MLLLTAGQKAECVYSSGSGGSSSANAGNSGKPRPASDFFCDLTADGKGIVIKGFTGGVVIVPEKIEDMPVTEIGEDAFNGKTTTYPRR